MKFAMSSRLFCRCFFFTQVFREVSERKGSRLLKLSQWKKDCGLLGSVAQESHGILGMSDHVGAPGCQARPGRCKELCSGWGLGHESCFLWEGEGGVRLLSWRLGELVRQEALSSNCSWWGWEEGGLMLRSKLAGPCLGRAGSKRLIKEGQDWQQRQHLPHEQ